MKTTGKCWNEYGLDYDALLELKPYTDMINEVWNLQSINQNNLVVDIGCGSGNFIFLAPFKEFFYKGFDNSDVMLQVARKKLKQRENTLFAKTDIDKCIFGKAESANNVVCINALYAFNKPKEVLKRIHRILKSGGSLSVVTAKKGYENGLILKAHAGDTGEEKEWLGMHDNPQKEERMIKKSFANRKLTEKFITIARHNRKISENKKYNFFEMEELKNLMIEIGFSITMCKYTYVDQCILIKANKE